MLLPEKMVEVEIIVHDDVKYDVLKTMQRNGFMHITSHEIKGLENAVPSSEFSKIVDMEFRIGKLLEILNIAKKRKKGMLSSLIPEVPERFSARRRERDEILSEAGKVLSDVENYLLKLYEDWERVNSEIERVKIQREQVKLLTGIPFDLRYLGEGAYVYITAGRARNIEPLLKLSRDKKAAIWYVTVGKKKNVEYIVVAAVHLKDRKALESALRFSGFMEFELEGWSGKPSNVLTQMEKRIKELYGEKEKLLKRIGEARKKYYSSLAILKDELYNEKLKEEVHVKFGKTRYTTVIRGYIPKKMFERGKREIEKASRGLSYIKWRDAKGEDVPVKYSNPKIFRPFQAFVDMYSTPKYGHIDPTVIIAPLFIIYFGLTLGDAGYGFIMALTGFIMWKLLGKHNWTNRTLGSVLFISGISAIIFGIIQGGVFGPLNNANPLHRIIHYKPIMDPMEDPISLLVISLIIGISQISLGLILGAYHHLKDKKYDEFLQAEVSWFILLPAGGALIGYYFGWWSLSPIILKLSTIFTITGLFLFLPGVMGKLVNRKASINGLFFFDITGMVGDWLSYSRLLALDLATSGIALTINILAGIISTLTEGASSMVCCMPLLIIGLALFALWARKKDVIKKSVALFLLIFGIIGVINLNAALYLFIVLFLVVGHIGNAFLQALGSFVHSLRLQYVEFFSKFYEGDGVKFSPFREIRRYSRVEVNK